MRFFRKYLILHVYPPTRELINQYLKTAPELERYVDGPNSLKLTYLSEIISHKKYFEVFKKSKEEDLIVFCSEIEVWESKFDTEFWEARKKLEVSEKQAGGYESYGKNNHHWAFKNIVNNFISNFCWKIGFYLTYYGRFSPVFFI
ncbi:hypothetical protein [Propionispora vibrioides]|uniref:hypothetical protein n=1 Tax=Propionispora vibrioides TaxID=112903 RepID=UPI001160060E|nr:hypothetical protein [Propionispora vibrioides]